MKASKTAALLRSNAYPGGGGYAMERGVIVGGTV